MMKKILVFCDYYLPGYKSGGGMRTIVNMVERLGDKFQFFVATRDHDGREDFTSYPNVKIDDWNVQGKAQVFYFSKQNLKLKTFRQIVAFVQPDAIYLNSFFATPAIKLLFLRRFGMIKQIPVIMAPCGELSEGALQLKSLKKKIFINGSKKASLYQNLIWKASSELEREEIKQITGENAEIYIAPDLPPKIIFPDFSIEKKAQKKSGELRLVFLSRFSRKKNLHFLLEVLAEIDGETTLDVVAPLEDKEYWLECEALIKKLPANIKVDYKGTIPHHEVPVTLANYHFFVLPTLGENFGHVFLEALASGCPLIISNKTPWVNLEEKKIGWDLPLENQKFWLEKLNYCVNMETAEYSQMCQAARDFSLEWLADFKVERATEIVLERAVSGSY